MIEDAPIVNDTRRIRGSVSHRFGNDLDKYLAHLREMKRHGDADPKPRMKETRSAYTTP